MGPFCRGARRARGFLLASAALGLALAASPAAAEGAHDVRIPAGPLDAALLGLAAQTHEQVLYSPALVAGRRAPAVSGTLTAEQALAKLLDHADIEVTRPGRGVLVLRAKPPMAAPIPSPAAAPSPGPASNHPFATDPAAPAAAAVAAASAAPTTVSTVEVTGTHLRGVETASPLVVMTRADLERTGEATVVGALRTLPENFAGGEAESTQATGANPQGANTVFSTGLNLRGLGSNATLVLVNGRRIAGSGAFGDFVDVSAIPTAAVERVEVLLDGASALYGSDAVGGVVNIILRRDYDGAEVRLRGGVGAGGDPTEGQASATLGHRWGSGGFVFAYEAQHRSALSSAERDFTESADLRPLGGTDHRTNTSFPGNVLLSTPAGLVPSYAIPAGQTGVGLTPAELQPGVVNLSNQRRGADILPRQDLQSAYLSVDQDVGDRLQLSADARYSYRDYRLHNAAPTSNLTVTRANPFFVSPIGAASETIAYSFEGDLPPALVVGSAETFTTTAGGMLRLPGDWRAEGYGAYGREVDRTHNTGLLNSGFVSEALGTTADNPATAFSTAANGFFNPFSGIPGSNSPSVLAFIGSGETGSYSRSEVLSGNLQADGSVWQAPAGAIKLAVGVQARRESLVRSGFNFVSGAAPTPAASTDVSRTVTAAYGELQVPLFGGAATYPGFSRLELSLAGRVEHYEAIGSTANPKIGLIWEPADGLAVRATYGTSFRAPELRELFDQPVNATTFLPLGAARVQTLVLTGGNPDLKPETARTWTAGLEYRPPVWPGLSLSAGWFDIHFQDRIDRPVATNLVGALTDPTLASFVQRIAPTANAADLALITRLVNSPNTSTLGGVFPPAAYGAIADERFVNTAALSVSGVDLAAQYVRPIGQDRLDLAARATYLLSYRQQVTPDAASVSRLNLVNFPLRLRARADADWTHGRLTLGASVNYANPYHDQSGVKIDSQTTLDLRMRLAPPAHGPMKSVSVLFSIRNVFDQAPPFYDNPFGYGYDPSNGDPIGRFISLQLVRTW